MASWAAVLAWTGFQYSGVEQSMTFAAKDGTHFWSNGRAWGTCTIRRGRARLNVLHGTVTLRQFTLAGLGGVELGAPATVKAGKSRTFELG
jgi:hypothetical protein